MPALHVARSCLVCGAPFVTANANQKYCSERCNWSSHRHRYPTRACAKCGADFSPTNNGQASCSLRCRPHGVSHGRPKPSPETVELRREARESIREARHSAKVLAGLADVAERTRPCEFCGAMFVGKRSGESRFCSKSCAGQERARRHDAGVEASLGHGSLTCPHCQTTFDSYQPHARFCSRDCYDAWHRGRGCERVRRRGKHKVLRLRPLVLERDGYICGICCLPIRRDVGVQHPLALTIDHIVPLAVGGSDRLDNLQPAHRMCNVEKGDDLPTWWARKSKAERR